MDAHLERQNMSRLNSRRRRARSGRGFTLIELLVVIAIIALMIALLMPVLGSAKESARRITCASQIKQVTMVLNQYGGVNHEALPAGYFQTPGIIAQGGREIVRMLTGTDSVSVNSVNTRLLTCPSWVRNSNVQDQVDYGFGTANGWGGYFEQGLLTRYTYAAGYGHWNRSSGSYLDQETTGDVGFWKGWHARNGKWAEWQAGMPGPLISYKSKQRPAECGIFQDRMWLKHLNAQTPGTPNNWSNYCGVITPSHPGPDGWPAGGNVGFGDGHVAWRNKDNVTEAIPAYPGFSPYVVW
jgi:prepilin-type N-terminal cleavage/methylation domain-containing protein/prepilin-type processing-associated H-X9-DG protein